MPRQALAPDVQVRFRLPGRTRPEVLDELEARLTAAFDSIVDTRLVPLLDQVETRDARMRVGQDPADPDVYSTYQVFAVSGESSRSEADLQREWDAAADEFEAAIRSSLGALGATIVHTHSHRWEQSLDTPETVR